MSKLSAWRGLLIPLGLGLLCALVATYLLVRHVQSIEESAALLQHKAQPQQAPKIAVVVSSVPLNAGDVLYEPQLRVRELDAESVPVDSIHPAQIGDFIGTALRTDIDMVIPAGKPIQQLHLAIKGHQRLDLTAGLVPFSFAVSTLQNHAGLIEAGDVLDIYRTNSSQAELLTERALVLLAGTQQLTIAVELSQMALLQQLAEQNRLLPVLRAINDPVHKPVLRFEPAVELIMAGREVTQLKASATKLTGTLQNSWGAQNHVLEPYWEQLQHEE